MRKFYFFIKKSFLVCILLASIIVFSACCFDAENLFLKQKTAEEILREASSYSKGYIKDGYGKLVWQSSFAMEIKISQNGIDNAYFETGKPVSFKVEGEILNSKTENENQENSNNSLFFSWDLGNGEKVEGEEFNYTFNEPGTYTVTLTASAGSASDTAVSTIWVAEHAGNLLVLDKYNCTVEVEKILNNDGPGKMEDVTFTLDVPTALQPFQEVINVDSKPLDFKEIIDGRGNLFYKYYIGGIAEGESASVLANFDINIYKFVINTNLKISSAYYQEDFDEALNQYLKSYKTIDSDSEIIKDTVKRIVGEESNPFLIAEKLYNFVVENIEYDWVRFAELDRKELKASELLNIKKGVCEDYSVLYAALCRASGIPAKYIAGIPISSIVHEGDKELESGHAWNEIYLPDYGWVPLDTTSEQIFLSENYSLNLRTIDDVRPENLGFFWEYYGKKPGYTQEYFFRVIGIEESDLIGISFQEYHSMLNELTTE